MTTLTPKFDFKNGGLTPVGAINRPIEKKLSETLSVLDFGAVGDGTTDDSAAIQAAINAAIAQQKSVYLPRTSSGLGVYLIKTQLNISAPISIYGDGINYSGIKCQGCNGFVIDKGVNQVSIEKMYISQAIRYTITPNAYSAILTLGDTVDRNFWHIYRDLFIDGFQYAIKVSYWWASLIDNVICVYCCNGILANGVSVNNFVQNCSLSGGGISDSFGIGIGDGTVATEGWIVTNSVIVSFGLGIAAYFASNCIVSNCIIDYFTQRGLIIADATLGASLNWTVSDCYIATGETTALTGIYLKNDFSASASQNRGHVICGNQILAYSGAVLTYGILISGTGEKNTNINGNRIVASTYDCEISNGTSINVTNNKFLGAGFYSSVIVNYNGNVGTILSSVLTLSQSNGSKNIYYGATIPVSGSYVIGDILYYTSPVAGGWIGAVCIASGTPGTWHAFGAIAP